MMDSKIRVLSEQTINQIAAGEVVENPASVVKELVENALDAGSQAIIIEIKGGGSRLIRVTDDGSGMGRDDLLLCFERHATSKIRKAEDLQDVMSMGFRGEALASIGAVAHVSVTSSDKQEGETLGASVTMDGGKLRGIETVARKRGTTVEVKSLFYNVPARKKFQKSESRSQSEVLKLLTKLSLAHPAIDFKLLADEKLVLASNPRIKKPLLEALKESITHVLGDTFLTGATPLNLKGNHCQMVGYMGAPSQARTNRLGQFLFINGRAVQSSQVSRALYEGYGTRLMDKSHPAFVLHLMLPPEWVDVNVHPQKREVRLREEKVIQDFVRKGVIQSLQGSETQVRTQEWKQPPEPSSFSQHEPLLTFREDTPSPPTEFSFQPQDFPVIGMYDTYLILSAKEAQIQIPGQEGPYEGLFLIDLRAAESRILYETFLHRDTGKDELQGLMIPLTLELMPHEKSQLMLYLDDIQKLGISIRPFGDTCFLVDAIDPRLSEDQIKPLLLELTDVLHEFADQKHVQKKREKKLALALCRYARSQKKGWSLVEAKQILKSLLKTSSPYLCPKGKATICYLEHRSIEKFFS